MPENTVLELEIGDGSCPYREFLQSVQRSGDLKALRNYLKSPLPLEGEG